MKTKYKKIDSSLLNFKRTILGFYEKWSPGLTYLELKIGQLPLHIVMDYMGYDEWKDTRCCERVHCPERIFNYSNKYYCYRCWNEFKKDGISLCKNRM